MSKMIWYNINDKQNRTELKYTRNGGFTMGRYLNPDNTEFEESVNSEIYIEMNLSETTKEFGAPWEELLEI